MPAQLAGLSALQGIAFGLFPVMWIVVTAIWFYELTVVSGRFEDLRQVFNSVGRGDMRVQAMLIAFCFGGMLEALAGFGAPVAITGAMLIAIGMPPIRAAVTVLVANTAPVAFGAMAIPITTAGNLTGIPATEIAAVVGRQTPVLALFVPMLLLFLVDGRRGFRQVWPIALVTGVAFAFAQFWCSSHFSYELTDVVASLVGLAAAVVMLRFWAPPHARRPALTGLGRTHRPPHPHDVRPVPPLPARHRGVRYRQTVDDRRRRPEVAGVHRYQDRVARTVRKPAQRRRIGIDQRDLHPAVAVHPPAPSC